ncbi:MAG: response regulator [bacterium]|nr:response regulator [bacterium]
MNNKFIFLFVLFALCLSWPASAQKNNLVFDHLTIKDGLSQTSVYCILQDSRGFMWFGTQDGLNKYDGYSFEVYRHDPENPNSVTQNFITVLTEDRGGNIWIGTRGNGFSRFSPDAGTFKHYIYNPPGPDRLSAVSIRSVTGICEARSGMLWIASSDSGLTRFDPVTETFTTYRHDKKEPAGLGSDSITAVIEDHEGTIWVGTRKGLNKLNPETGRFTRYLHDPQNPGSLSNNEVTAVAAGHSGTIWVGTAGGGLNRLNPGTGRFKNYTFDARNPAGLSHNHVSEIYISRGGVLWIGTIQGGLNRLHPESEIFTRFRHDSSNPRSLTDDQILCIHEDRTGILWIGTFSDGVNKLNPRTAAFHHYAHNPADPRSLASRSVSAICETRDGTFWVATDNGLNKYDPHGDGFRTYKHEPGNPASLSHNNVVALYQDKAGVLWVGTQEHLNRFIPGSETFKTYPFEPFSADGLKNNAISVILEDASGRFWLGTGNGGLNELDRASGKAFLYSHDPRDAETLSHPIVLAMCEDRRGNLWVGTVNGLNRFDPRTRKFRRYLREPGNPGSLSHNTVISIHESRDGVTWVGTLGGGLSKFDPQTDTFSHYNKKHGLLNEVVNGILEDETGHLWLSTNRGIFKFNPPTGTFINFDVKDGLQSDEFNVGASHKGHGGRFYFGGVNGLNAFFPHEIIRNTYIPPVVLTGFLEFNKEVKTTIPIWALKELVLSHKDYVFSFEFAALDFSVPGQNQYAYKLDGFDDDWLSTDAAKRFATYTNLDAGEYTFRVKASNNHHVWNEEGVELKIIITPPFWGTAWFKIVAALFILAVTYLLYRLRIRTIQAQKRKLEELVNERTENLKEKKEEVEEINNIVKTINAEIELSDFLESLLRETFGFKGIEQARAIVYDADSDIYSCEAAAGGAPGKKQCKGMTREALEAKYIVNANEIITDVFLSRAKDTGDAGSALLAIKIQAKDTVSGYLIFDHLNAREILKKKHLERLETLKDHIVSAFLRSNLLTELKNANEAARSERQSADKANRSKSDFLARMSHEIRTPMNSIIGFTDMLLDTELNEEQLDYARTINRSGQALLNLINDILDFSKVESGQLTLEAIDFDPEVMAFDVCELMRPRIGVRPVEIICRIADKVPSNVKGDPGRYRQVLINLLGNAVKFTHKGEIVLSVEVDSESKTSATLHARVTDTGIGIPKEKLGSVFEVFQQASGSTARQFGGSGLGLPICKQISKLMGGDVWVESEPGKSSTFHFTAVMKKTGRKAIKPVTPESLTNKKVLIVDDNKNNLDILTHLLTAAGMDVVTLTRGTDVIPMLVIGNKTRSPFDLCILDILMPDITGYEVAKQIRLPGSPSPNLPLLAFTSSFSRRSKAFKDSGFDGFLPKPVQRKRLIEVLEQLLGKHKAKKGKPKEKVKEEMVTRHSIVDEAKHSTRIMLAEDNPINQKLANFMLTKAGYQVVVVDNGKQALEKFTAQPDKFDMIFMDVQMPEMNGIDACKAVRRRGFGDIPIIAMTAQAMKGDREKCLEAGMNDYMSKPIKREIVFAMVKKWAFVKKGLKS